MDTQEQNIHSSITTEAKMNNPTTNTSTPDQSTSTANKQEQNTATTNSASTSQQQTRAAVTLSTQAEQELNIKQEQNSKSDEQTSKEVQNSEHPTTPTAKKTSLSKKKEPLNSCRLCCKGNEERPLIRFPSKGRGKPEEYIHAFCGTIATAPPWNKPEFELLHSKGIRHKYRGTYQDYVNKALTGTRSGVNPINNVRMFMMRDFDTKLKDIQIKSALAAAAAYEESKKECIRVTGELDVEPNVTVIKPAIKHNLIPDKESEAPNAKKGRGRSSNTLPALPIMRSSLPAPPGKIRCPCGGLHQPPGTAAGKKSWSRHIQTKEHLRWLQTNNMNNISPSASVASPQQARKTQVPTQPIPNPKYVPPAPVKEPFQLLENFFKDVNLAWNHIDKLSKNGLICKEKKEEFVTLLTMKLDSMYESIPAKIASNPNMSFYQEAHMTWTHLANLMENSIISQEEKDKKLSTLLQTLELFYKNSSLAKNKYNNVEALIEMFFLHLSNLSANTHVDYDRKMVLVSSIILHLETLFQSCCNSNSDQSLHGADIILNYLDKLRADPLIPESKKKEIANLLIKQLESVYKNINNAN